MSVYVCVWVREREEGKTRTGKKYLRKKRKKNIRDKKSPDIMKWSHQDDFRKVLSNYSK